MLYNQALIPELPQPTTTRSGAGGRGASEFKSPIPGEDYFGIPKSPEGLQYTDNLMKSSVDLFKKRQDLINYAKTMWTRNGIDVTNPDPANPASVVAAETFKMEIGNYLSGVDRAREGQKAYMAMLPRYMDNTFAPGAQIGQQYASELSPEELGYSMKVAPELEFAQGGINRSFDTTKDYNAASRDAALFQGQYNNPNAPGTAGIQARAAQTLNPMFNIQAVANKATGPNPVAGLVTEWGQLSAGSHPSFQITDKVGPKGSFLSESSNNAFIGKTFGKYQDPSTQVNRDFIVTSIVKDNDTGDVYAVNDAGFRKVLPKDNIDVSIRQVIPGSAINEYEKYLADAQKQGLLPQQTGQGGLSTFTLPASMFVPTKDQTKAQEDQSVAQKVKPQALAIQQEILGSLDVLDSSFWNRWNPFSDAPDILEYDSDKGVIKVTKIGDAYKITVNDAPEKDKKTTRKFSKAEVSSFLTDANVIGMKLKNSKGEEIPMPTTQAPVTPAPSVTPPAKPTTPAVTQSAPPRKPVEMPSQPWLPSIASPITQPTAPKFDVGGKSGSANMHPWAVQVGNMITDSLGVKIEFNSIHRTKEQNKEVGGKDTSFHLIGAGIDVKPADWKKVPKEVKDKLIRDLNVQVIDEGDHVHLEPKDPKVLAKFEPKYKAKGTVYTKSDLNKMGYDDADIESFVKQGIITQ